MFQGPGTLSRPVAMAPRHIIASLFRVRKRGQCLADVFTIACSQGGTRPSLTCFRGAEVCLAEVSWSADRNSGLLRCRVAETVLHWPASCSALSQTLSNCRRSRRWCNRHPLSGIWDDGLSHRSHQDASWGLGQSGASTSLEEYDRGLRVTVEYVRYGDSPVRKDRGQNCYAGTKLAWKRCRAQIKS